LAKKWRAKRVAHAKWYANATLNGMQAVSSTFGDPMKTQVNNWRCHLVIVSNMTKAL
jgi:hypothetical protein